MRNVVLMVAFASGVFVLVPPRAMSRDGCQKCECVQMEAWITAIPGAPNVTARGLRKTDPNDLKKTIPVAQATGSGGGTFFNYAPACGGVREVQKDVYLVYNYYANATKDCVPPREARVADIYSVTFANPGDWENCDKAGFEMIWNKCGPVMVPPNPP